MASPLLFAQPPSFNLNPTIFPPTAGDLEESRIRRQVDLAKLRELTLAPNFEQQRLNLARQGQTAEQQYRSGVLSENVSHNVAEEKHWADLLGLDQNKLKETAREHDSALSELTDYHRGVLRNQLTDSFMAHLAPLYAGNPEVIQNVLKNRGLPELSAAAQLLVDKQNKTAADTTLQQINLGKTKGIDTTPLIENLKTTNPDAYNLIKDRVPSNSTSVDTRSTATRLGETLRKFGPYVSPFAIPYALYQGGKGIVKKIDKKSLIDFASAVNPNQ
jgi:hypothetical protein